MLAESAGWVACMCLFVREVFAHLRDGDFALNLLAETLIVYRRCERWVEHVVTHTRTQVVDKRFAAFKLICLSNRQRFAAAKLYSGSPLSGCTAVRSFHACLYIESTSWRTHTNTNQPTHTHTHTHTHIRTHTHLTPHTHTHCQQLC